MSEPASEPRRTLASRVLKATVAIAVAHGIAKVLGLVQWRVIGNYYGVGIESDVFVLVFSQLLWSLYLIGEESLGPAFLPVFMETKEKSDEDAAWRFTSTLASLQFLLLALAIALLMLFPDQAIRIFTRFEGGKEDLSRSALAVEFLFAMAPALLGLSMGSLTYMVLNGYKKFFWAAFADAALKGALLLGIALGRAAGLGDDALIAGVLAAGATKIAVHVLALGPKLRLFRLGYLNLSDPNFRRFLALVAPLLVGIVFAKVRDYFNNAWVVSSLEVGMVTYNEYGRKIYSAAGWLIPYPLSIALFPFFCEMVARDDKDALAAFITRACRMLLMVFLPLTAVIVALSVPLAQVLFESGRFSAADAEIAGRVNVFYSLVLPFYAVEYIFMQAYFSTRRMVLVTVIGMIFSALSMAISYVGVVVMGMKGIQAVFLVASGYTFARALKVFCLSAMLRATGLPILPLGPTLLFIARAAVLTAAVGGATYGSLLAVERALPAPATPAAQEDHGPAMGSAGPEGESPKSKVSGLRALLSNLPKLALPGAVAAVVFFAGCRVLRFEELDEMIAFTKEKLRRRKAKPKE